MLGAPEIDSRDFFPLEALLRARYVVVVEPFQHHLAPERQGVVAVVVELFGADREFARDFTRLLDGFTLAGGAVATIYGRVQPTTPTVAARTLRLMQEYVGERPGGQPDWVALNPDGGVAVSPDRDEGYTVTLRPGRRDEPPTTPLLYAGTAARGVTVGGEVAFHDERCPGVALRFSRLDHEGRISPVAEVPRHLGGPAAFTVALPAGGAAELLLDLAHGERGDAPDDCTLTVRRLTVTPEGGDGGGAAPATATR